MEILPEPKVLSQVSARVRERVPGVTAESVDEEVAVLFRNYADSRVREFLPLLVEREAVAHLKAISTDVA